MRLNDINKIIVKTSLFKRVIKKKTLERTNIKIDLFILFSQNFHNYI